MRSVLVKQIRETMKNQGQSPTGPAEYFIAQSKKKVVYFYNKEGLPESTTVDRIVIVNKTKNKYRKVKKMMKKQRQYGVSLAA